MDIVIYIVSGLFLLLAAAILFAWYRSRHGGLALLAATYGAAAGLALLYLHWWPLAAGFAMVWVLRLMGLDPVPRAPDDKREPGAG